MTDDHEGMIQMDPEEFEAMLAAAVEQLVVQVCTGTNGVTFLPAHHIVRALAMVQAYFACASPVLADEAVLARYGDGVAHLFKECLMGLRAHGAHESFNMQPEYKDMN